MTTSNYSAETVKAIKNLVKEKRWKKILMIYYSEADKLPPFPVFLKSIKDEEGKRKIINYLIFKEKDPFFERTGFLKSHFFRKTGIEKMNKDFLKKREILLQKIKQKEQNVSDES